MISFHTPKTVEEWELYYDLRYRILREPLGKERGSERNEGDATGIHIAMWENDSLVGIARLDAVDEIVGQARFVAIENQLQGKGYGQLIMTKLEREAQKIGYTKIILHARDYALPFYLKLGYTLIGPSYKLFDVLQHFEMHKELPH